MRNTNDQETCLGTKSGAAVLSRYLAIILALALLIGVYELYWYRYFLQYTQLKLKLGDWGFVASAIVGKSLYFCVPWAVIAAALSRKLPRFVVSAIGLGVPLLLLLFFAWDVRVQALFGSHISFFVASATEEQGVTWAGDPSQFYLPMFWMFGITLGMVSAVLLVSHSITKGCEISKATVKRVFAAEVIIIAAILAFSVGFRWRSPTPLSLERLYASFPVESFFFNWESVAGLGRAAFGSPVNDQFESVEERLYPVANTATLAANSWIVSEEISRPNIVLFIVECFRQDALNAKSMPRLQTWANQGIQFKNHYCGSNCSPLGTFALLYGRTPLSFYPTLKANIEPVLVTGLKASGYETTLSSSWLFKHRQMDAFLNDKVFDHVLLHHSDSKHWPEMDAKCVEDARRQLQNASENPQFVLLYLNSTHFSYTFPDSYADLDVAMPDEQLPSTFNPHSYRRFQRSLRYMDDLLGDFVDEFGENTIVAVTGDHGESFGEDGFQCHGSRLSTTQAQTSFAICGPRVPQLIIPSFTTHMDFVPTLAHILNGKQVDIPNGHGIDVLEEPVPQSRMLVQELSSAWDLLLLSSHGRLLLSMDRTERRLSIRGFADANGEVASELQRPLGEVGFWKDEISKIVNRWSR